ncbi:MAG TPA: DNA repair protein RadA, partial [Rudaea sp.]|nr:DNA repair protein RadA [Rudaea sp.]
MAKAKTAYVCNQCGAEYGKWQGQCEACGAWNTLSEFIVESAKPGVVRRSSYAGAAAQAQITPLTKLAAQTDTRTRIGIGELDRVLGGGLVEGSVVLVGGDPGIGKSTLLLQTLGALGARMKSLYVSGEESLAQIAARAQRLGLPLEPLRCLAETCVERILESVHKEFSGAENSAQNGAPRVLVIDSIQTIWTELLTAAPGSVSQVRESAAKLVRYAKETGTSIFLVGHVTKEGGIAGPRVLEHMVDAVLYFEGEAGSRFRVLRAFKNRFGAVNELGVFAMSDKGLREVPNPSAIFLSAHSAPTPGSAVMVTREGTRPLLVE